MIASRISLRVASRFDRRLAEDVVLLCCCFPVGETVLEGFCAEEVFSSCDLVLSLGEGALVDFCSFCGTGRSWTRCAGALILGLEAQGMFLEEEELILPATLCAHAATVRPYREGMTVASLAALSVSQNSPGIREERLSVSAVGFWGV